MEVQHSTLLRKIKKDGQVVEPDVAVICAKVLALLYDLHRHGLFHRNLNLQTIAVCGQEETVDVKFVARTKLSGSWEVPRQSMDFTAPELLPEGDGRHAVLFYCASDVWSLGVITYTLLSGTLPFTATAIEEVIRNVKFQTPDLKMGNWEMASAEAKDLVSRMLTKNPEERISVLDALGHSWIQRHVHLSTEVGTGTVRCSAKQSPSGLPSAQPRPRSSPMPSSSDSTFVTGAAWSEASSSSSGSSRRSLQEDSFRNQSEQGDRFPPYQKSPSEGEEAMPYMVVSARPSSRFAADAAENIPASSSHPPNSSISSSEAKAQLTSQWTPNNVKRLVKHHSTDCSPTQLRMLHGGSPLSPHFRRNLPQSAATRNHSDGTRVVVAGCLPPRACSTMDSPLAATTHQHNSSQMLRMSPSTCV